MSEKLSYDPKLRTAMAEIKEVLKKHDIGGYVALQSRTHAEFQVLIDVPTWSVARYIKNDAGAVHLKLYTKSRHKDTQDTVGMVASLRDLCAIGFQQTDLLMKQIEAHVEVDHPKLTPEMIKNDDREAEHEPNPIS